MPAPRSDRKTHEVVADRLREQILSGEFKVGHRLPPEDELTEQFGIARTSLREALRVLESQGLLTIRRGRGGGPVVTHPNLEPAAMALAVSLQLQGTTLGDLDAARRLIELQVVGDLARSHTPEDLVVLGSAADRASAAADQGDAKLFGAAVTGFHETLIERSGNVTLTTISRLLHGVVTAYYTRAVQNVDIAAMRRAAKSYQRLLEHIEANDPKAAVAHWDRLMSYTVSGSDPSTPLDVTTSG